VFDGHAARVLGELVEHPLVLVGQLLQRHQQQLREVLGQVGGARQHVVPDHPEVGVVEVVGVVPAHGASSGAGPSRTEPSRAALSRATPSRAAPSRAAGAPPPMIRAASGNSSTVVAPAATSVAPKSSRMRSVLVATSVTATMIGSPAAEYRASCARSRAPATRSEGRRVRQE